MSWTEPGMFTSSGAYLTLSNSDVHIEVDEMIATITTTHTYTNTENTNIEAVYTFPIPREAVLLSMIATVGDRTKKGHVVERADASRQYENAIGTGNSAVLVEYVEDGMQCMSVGNIMPGESATVTISYALILRWSGDTVRLQLPSTIAPRYGAQPADRQLHHVPTASMLNVNTMRPTIVIRGLLTNTNITSPTHPFSFRFDVARGEVVATSQQSVVMDRDLVLTFTSQTADRSWAVAAPDGDRTVILAGLSPTIESSVHRRPLKNIVFLIDCSGSMAGDSIDRAKAAIIGALNQLVPGDRVNVIRFGTSAEKFSLATVVVGSSEFEDLKIWCERLQANMGSTNAYQALKSALDSMHRGSIMFISDGEVNDWQTVVDLARSKRIPIYCVGIGSAPNMPFVELLAKETGAACEFVTPNESIVQAIRRQCMRMLESRATTITSPFPDSAIDTWMDLNGPIVFEGDTLLLTGRYSKTPKMVELRDTNGRVIASVRVAHTRLETVKRLAAAYRLSSLDRDRARQTAIHYQLISKETSCVMVEEVSDAWRVNSLPELRTVAQTLAAGWSGNGKVRREEQVAAKSQSFRNHEKVAMRASRSMSDDHTNSEPAFLRRISSKSSNGREETRLFLKSVMDLSAAETDNTPRQTPERRAFQNDRHRQIIQRTGSRILQTLEKEPHRLSARKLDEFFAGNEMQAILRELELIASDYLVEREVIIRVLQLLLELHRDQMSQELTHRITASIAPKLTFE